MGGESRADERAGSPVPGFLESKIHAAGVALISGARCTAVEAGHRVWHWAWHRFGTMTPTGLPSGPATMRRDPPPLRGGAAGDNARRALRAVVFPLCVDGRDGRRGRNRSGLYKRNLEGSFSEWPFARDRSDALRLAFREEKPSLPRSCTGGFPNSRLYARVNCEQLS
jgi:hypothetical protein